MATETGSSAAMPSGKSAAIIGAAVPRIDGPLKTSGTATYTADFNLPRMVYAVPVRATISSGTVTSLDTTAAEGMRGVLKIYTPSNAPRLYRVNKAAHEGGTDESRPPLADNRVTYYGQFLAVVVAESMDQARAAVSAVKVAYSQQKPDVSTDLNDGLVEAKLSTKSERGNVDSGFTQGTAQVDEVYSTPIETHNPIEMHACVADWDGRTFTIYETSQGVNASRGAMAQLLGVPLESVLLITKYLGSGFGGKLSVWPQSPLAAMASRELNRPVKFVVDRHSMFETVGHRPHTQQHVRLAATADGHLTCVSQDYTNDSSILDDKGENCGEATPILWSTPNLRVRASIVHRNVGTPTAMRGPGAVPGLFATETAMDELAYKLNMDPVQLRLVNEPAMDEEKKKPFSSRHMKECLTVGAEKFGWSKRTPGVASMKDGDKVIGYGIACASWGAGRAPVETSVRLNDDGTAWVACGTQDIGTGTYTIFAQVVHARTGIPLERIMVSLGDTRLPLGPTSGGSMVTGSVVPSIDDGARGAVAQLLEMATAQGAPFAGHKPEELAMNAGHIHLASQPAERGIAFEQILHASRVRSAQGGGKTSPLDKTPAADKYSFHSYGAHFAEVEYDPGIARLRVRRVVSVIDVGRVINLKPARNQVEGAVVMGLGMAMLEVTEYDQRTGKPVNNNLADYLVATHPDSPLIDVTFLDYPDPHISSFGARGVGEIGLAGVAPAITNAIYHATGVRKRDLPVRIEDLLPKMHIA